VALALAASGALASELSPALVSATPAGAAGNGPSGTFGLAISVDGGSVAFASTATDLAAADTDPTPDVFVRDVDGARTVLASANAAGERGNAMSERPSLSADGSRIAFLSLASNLDPADGDALIDAYVKDLASGRVGVASTSSAGEKANGATTAVTLSADGGTVAFASTATNLDRHDTDPLPDVYVKNLSTGALTLASVTADGKKGQPGLFGVGGVSLSADGTRVAFSTDAPLSEEDDNGVADIYVKDLQSGRLDLASATADGAAGNAASTDPALTADGRNVAFASFASGLDPRDSDALSDVYVKDLLTGALLLASTNGAGVKADGRATTPAISEDGRVVAFSSDATNLGPQPADTPQLDVYVKNIVSGEVALAPITADGARADALSLYPSLSAHGSRVAFTTPATNLSGSDTNGLADVYLVGADESNPRPEPTQTAVPEPTATATPEPRPTVAAPSALTGTHGPGRAGSPKPSATAAPIGHRRVSALRTRRGVRGRLLAARAAVACTTRAPVLLEHRVRIDWRQMAATRTDAYGHYAFRIAPGRRPLRVRAPQITVAVPSGARMRCPAATRKVR
jgi:Tol biopolymer transport system component